MSIRNNPPRRTALIWVGIAVLGIIGIFIPSMIGMDGFNGGFAISFLTGFVAIIGIIAAIIYARLAGTLDHILRNENILAHWTYTPEEWSRYTEQEHKEEAAAKKGLFIMVAVISVIVGIGLWLVAHYDPVFLVLIILAIIVLTGLTAYLTTFFDYRRNRKHLGEAHITRDAVYLNRQLHIWEGLGACLEEVVYEGAHRPGPIIRIEYSTPGTNSRNYYTARVPVPHGEEEKAKQVVAEILAAHPLK